MSDLPEGVHLLDLTPHGDERGSVVELFRDSWGTGFAPVQWNAVHSGAGVVRGMHCHADHGDYLVVLDGGMRVVLADLRRGSTTHRQVLHVDLRGGGPALIVPPGVGHAFETAEPAVVVYGLDEGWSTDDELGCHWSDPALRAHFRTDSPVLSPRDAAAGSLAELEDGVAARMDSLP